MLSNLNRPAQARFLFARTNMQCSSPIPVSRALAIPSPSSLTIASANGNVLEVRDINTLSLLHSITTSGTHISHIVWSPSSDILAAASIPSNSVVLVNPTTGAVLADVHDSPLPIAALSLSSTGILLVSHVHSIAITLFSVHRAKVLAIIPFVSHRSPSVPIFSWSPCAKFVAIATRTNSVHGIVIVSLANGAIITSLKAPEQLAGLSEVTGLRWLPSGNILLWNAPLDPLSCSVTLITPNGKVLSPTVLQTEQEQSDEILEEVDYSRRLSVDTDYGKVGLGIKTLAASSTGSLLAIGGYDGRLRIVNVARWSVVKVLGHDAPEINATSPPVIFRERTKDEVENANGGENDPANGNLWKSSNRFKSEKSKDRRKRSYFQVLDAEGGVEITKRVRSATAPGSNTFGVSNVEFSQDGKYISSRSDKAGNVVFIWDVGHLRLSAVMILERDVRVVRWSKADGDGKSEDGGAQLAISCGEEFVYIWRQSGAAAVGLRGEFNLHTIFKARKIAWCHDSSALVVTDGISSNAFMSVYVGGGR